MTAAIVSLAEVRQARGLAPAKLPAPRVTFTPGDKVRDKSHGRTGIVMAVSPITYHDRIEILYVVHDLGGEWRRAYRDEDLERA